MTRVYLLNLEEMPLQLLPGNPLSGTAKYINNDLEEPHPNNGSLCTTPDPIFNFFFLRRKNRITRRKRALNN